MDAFQVLAEPRRRDILSLIWDCERTAGDIAGRFDVTFSAISQHLGVLRDAGLVTVRRAGTQRHYRADREALAELTPYLERMWGDRLRLVARLAEEEEAQRPP